MENEHIFHQLSEQTFIPRHILEEEYHFSEKIKQTKPNQENLSTEKLTNLSE